MKNLYHELEETNNWKQADEYYSNSKKKKFEKHERTIQMKNKMKFETKLELLKLESLKAKALINDEYVRKSISKEDWEASRGYIHGIMCHLKDLERIINIKIEKEKEGGSANRS